LRLSAVSPPIASPPKRASYWASAARRSRRCIPMPIPSFHAWSSNQRHPLPALGKDQPFGRRQVEARLEPEEWPDASDHLAGGRHRIPPGGGKSKGLLERLRFVEDDEQLVARLVGRHDRGERVQQPGLGIAPAHDLLRRPGLASDIVAIDVGPGRRALL